MMPYIINAGLILTGCFAFYKIFLQKETFYRLNRAILVGCVAISFSLPLVRVPQEWSLLNQEAKLESEQPTYRPEIKSIQHYPLIKRSQEKETGTDVVESAATSLLTRQATVQESENSISFAQVMKWMLWLYWIGVIIFSLNFLLQIIILLVRAYFRPVIRDGQYRIVEMEGEHAPCSFLNNIFINPANYDWNTYSQILLHEKVHAAEKHSLDILFAEAMLIFQWFNPFAWMYRKEIENNLEFLTDKQVLEKGEMEVTSYQMSLLKVSAAHLPLSLTSNYNQSLLKKRIAMMNAKKSNLNSSWKYFFLMPMFAIFACLLNEPVALAQTKPSSNTKNASSNKNAQNKNSNSNKNNSKNTSNNKSNVNANKEADETDADVDADKNNNKNENKNRNSNHDHESSLKTEGYWFATIKDNEIRFQFTNSEKKDKNSYNGTEFPLSEFPNLPKGTSGEFKLTREAGTMNFTGKFDGDQGMGKYKFVADKSYVDFMSQKVTEKLNDEDQMVFFMLNVKKSYVQMLHDEGYTKLEKDDVISTTALNVDKAFINMIKENGFKNVELEELVSLQAMHIDEPYIKEIREAGYKNITLDELVSFKAMGIDKAYINKVGKSNSKDGEMIEAEHLISLKALNIDDDFANQFKSVGYTNISTEDLISMKSVGVTPEYIKSFQAAGYKNIPAENFVSLKALSVTPDFAKGFLAMGYKDLDAEELVSLKSLGVTPAFIKGFNDIGFKDIPIDDVVSVKAVGVTPAYVKEMKAKGFNYSRLEKYVTLKSLAEN